MKKLITYIDPPSGWRYGFPKVIPEEHQMRTLEWLVENGYPQKEIDALGDYFFCRYWAEEEENKSTEIPS